MSELPVPRRAEAVLQSLSADTEFRDDVLGDLAEEYALRVRWDGRVAARRWYYRESLRLVPYLLRDRRRASGYRGVGETVWMLAWSTLAVSVFHSALLTTTYRLVFMITGIPINAYLHHWETTDGWPATQLLMLTFTAVTGSVGGLVAASIGGRPRLANALVAGAAWAGLMLTGWGRVPAVFLALNVATVLTASFAGGLVRTLKHST